jgi:hypothetical protein
MTQKEKIEHLKEYYPELPDNLSVGGILDLENTQISVLPDNLSVGGSLYLANTQISVLPDNLSVGGSLFLSNTQISVLPDNLSVGGSLYLRYTPNLKSTKNVIISDYIGSRENRTVYFKHRDLIKCGCFSGNLKEFTNRVHNEYEEGHPHRTEYDLFINECKGIYEVQYI